MAGRYMISGVQLGMLQALKKEEDRKQIVNKIITEQFMFNSINGIKDDIITFINKRKK